MEESTSGFQINTRNWVGKSQDRDYWRALVNAALNLREGQMKEMKRVERRRTQHLDLRKTEDIGSYRRKLKIEKDGSDSLSIQHNEETNIYLP